MSPKNNNPNVSVHENSMIWNSPAPRTQAKALFMASPSLPLRSATTVNYTTTATLQSDLAQQKSTNTKMLQRIQTLEGDLSRGMSREFLSELESKIHMLSTLNRKLQADNAAILQVVDNGALKEQVNGLTAQKQTLYKEVKEAQSALPLLIQQNQQMEVRIANESENWEIRDLVNELENKVQGLIVENERLSSINNEKYDEKNYQYELRNLKLEVEQIQLQYQNQKFDEDNLKAKCKELERKYNQARRGTVDRSEKEWQSKINDLEGKVQLLIDENEKLNQALSDPENTQTDINDLQERISIILVNNQKMKIQIDEYKRKVKKN